ncbi:putative aminohydrolase SsnA [Vagococcus sp. BWB3-3]|uniref:Aminohydrolase SsnA n=1 Tax=Vagococcus allomyrinae TaxID=2794353 RepID=A0A940PDJ7_9ENTE|nr:putative aminohydrolase SsnA [Vagococcus allomyrinae]MBP1041988.1 putative aminohydrolase SsnA [Vagococcus allomyrinae]
MLLIGNGRVISRDSDNLYLENGCVAITDDQIEQVGTTEEMKQKYPEAEFIDVKGKVIMPGFVNMHNHIYSTFARGLSINGYHPQNFMDILRDQWWRIDGTLTLQDSYHSATTAYVDCIKNGVTTVFDHHASYGEVAGSLGMLSQAADELGVRTCLCYEVSDRNGEAQMKAAVKENADFIKTASKRTDDMQKAMMGLHASFTLSDASLELCAANKPADVGYHIHIAEGMADVHDSLEKYGKPVVNRLFDFGILGEKSMAGHCIYISPREMELIKETNTMVVTNPESNMGNAVGCPPAMHMFNEYKIMMGLGTDGYTQDMTETYKVANIIHKHHLGDPNAAWSEVPQMLFDNNPKMANRYFEKPLGVLKAGAAADVIVLDYQAPTPLTEANINSHILFGMTGRCVTDTIINGQIRMRNRELVGVDEAKIWAEGQAQGQDLWQRINS